MTPIFKTQNVNLYKIQKGAVLGGPPVGNTKHPAINSEIFLPEYDLDLSFKYIIISLVRQAPNHEEISGRHSHYLLINVNRNLKSLKTFLNFGHLKIIVILDHFILEKLIALISL